MKDSGTVWNNVGLKYFLFKNILKQIFFIFKNYFLYQHIKII